MFAISFRNLWEHKLRTLLLGGAIVVGVAFVVASFILTDSIGAAFENIFTESLEGIDVQVVPELEEGSGGFSIPRIPGDLADEIEAVDGVATVEAGMQDFVVIEDPDAEGGFGAGFGPPSFGVSWPEGPSPFRLIDGEPPTADDHVVFDIDAAESRDLEIGDTVRIAPGTGRLQEFTLVGTISFGEGNALLGASFIAFEFERALDFFNTGGEVTGYSVATDPDADVDTVVDALNGDVLPDGTVAVNARSQAEEQSADLQEGLGFITTFLLVFAAIALIVGAFVVYNAFQVVLAQRTRELGLLRVLGGTRGNILRMVLSEAALLGFVMSVVGVPVGLGVAWLARTALDAFGGGIPAGDLIVQPRTVIVALVVGTAVALVSAVLPARRANRVSPMAALRDQPELATPLRWVWIAGAVLVAAAVALLTWAAVAARSGGVFAEGNDALLPVGIGAFALFLGLVLASRALARPVIGALGTPLRSVTGGIARENARRSPARTATTATSLMIGVGLVIMVAILTTTLQDTIDRTVADSFQGDLVVSSSDFGFGGGMPTEVGDIVAGVDGVATVDRSNLATATLADGTEIIVTGVVPDTFEVSFTFEDVEGSFRDLEGATIATDRGTADARDYAIGDEVELTVGETTDRYEIVAIAALSGGLTDGQTYFMGYDTVAGLRPDAGDAQLSVSVADDADPAAVQADIEEALTDFAGVQVTSLADISAQIEAGIGGIQVFLTVLLLVSVFVALFGIVLTLYLAVFERTHEIGLLRAVGMTRDQLGSTIRWEAVLIALFGTVLGLVLGLAGGWALSAALIGEGAVLAVPWAWMAGSLIGGAIAGFLASIVPAAAAGRMDVLAAIAYE